MPTEFETIEGGCEAADDRRGIRLEVTFDAADNSHYLTAFSLVRITGGDHATQWEPMGRVKIRAKHLEEMALGLEKAAAAIRSAASR